MKRGCKIVFFLSLVWLALLPISIVLSKIFDIPLISSVSQALSYSALIPIVLLLVSLTRICKKGRR